MGSGKQPDLQVRIGLNSGPLISGVISATQVTVNPSTLRRASKRMRLLAACAFPPRPSSSSRPSRVANMLFARSDRGRSRAMGEKELFTVDLSPINDVDMRLFDEQLLEFNDAAV